MPVPSPIPIIDLFAGPGGLGEGFSSLQGADGARLFKIALSVEADEHAHQTLELRAFYRQFRDADRPKAYYDYVRSPSPSARGALFAAFPVQAAAAQAEAWCHRLSLKSAETVTARAKEALGDSNQPWVLIGGPPCQAYSLAGRSRRAHDADFADDEKHTLYEHYLRIITDLRPTAFVMENVKGILSARIGEESTIRRVLRDLGCAGPGYEIHSFVRTTATPAELSPSDYLIRSEEYGIPQARHRVILLGIRKDVREQPGQIEPFGSEVTVSSVLESLPQLRSALSRRDRKHADSENRWLKILEGAVGMMDDELTANAAQTAILQTREHTPGLGHDFFPGAFTPGTHAAWYNRDRTLGGITNHNSRTHMTSDIQRYLFCASFAQVRGRAPVLADFPDALLPAHANVVAGALGTHFADRFRVQLGGRSSTTITSHISKDGHYYIHYDPRQCRSLSVREAARLQTFPDDYFFEGNRTQQYHQVGNAVPPLLARQIAVVVANVLGREPEDAFLRSQRLP